MAKRSTHATLSVAACSAKAARDSGGCLRAHISMEKTKAKAEIRIAATLMHAPGKEGALHVTYELGRIEQGVQLVRLEDPFLLGRLPHRLSRNVGLLGQGRRVVIADFGDQGSGHGQAA